MLLNLDDVIANILDMPAPGCAFMQRPPSGHRRYSWMPLACSPVVAEGGDMAQCSLLSVHICEQ